MPNEVNMNVDSRIKYLTNLIDDNDLAVYRYERARLYLKIGRNPAALRDINQAIGEKTENIAYYVVKTQAEFSEGNYDEALKAALYAEKNGYASTELKVLLGELYYQKNNKAKALSYLKEVLAEYPDNFNAVFLSGKIYAEQQDTTSSFKYLEQALTLNPDDNRPYETYMKLLNELGLFERSAKVGITYLKYIEPNAAFAYYYGETLEFNKQVDSALVWYEKSFTLQNHWKPGIKLAKFRLRNGDFREAARLYEIALSQNPAIENGYYELGYTYEYYLDQLEEALKAYRNGNEKDTLNNKYPFYMRRVQRKIEFKNFQDSF
ncbi:MAG: tetratricopeptide repeat protein [Bacteroidota bacterium]